jgi:hypothetical protein
MQVLDVLLVHSQTLSHVSRKAKKYTSVGLRSFCLSLDLISIYLLVDKAL